MESGFLIFWIVCGAAALAVAYREGMLSSNPMGNVLLSSIVLLLGPLGLGLLLFLVLSE